MIYIEKNDRNVFSVIINYRHSESYEQDNYRFLLAHVAEHLLLVDICRKLSGIGDGKSGIEKFVSGLTGVENTNFTLTCCSSMVLYILDFLKAAFDRGLEHVSEQDCIEQKKHVLSEYIYSKDSFHGCCNAAFNIVNGFCDINIKQALEKISLRDIKLFIQEHFVKERCTVVYVGKKIDIAKGLVVYRKRSNEDLRIRDYMDCNFSKLCIVGKNKNETWFGYCRSPINNLAEFYENEIISKTIRFIMLSCIKKKNLGSTVKDVGSHYSQRSSCVLYYTDAVLEGVSFGYSEKDIKFLIDNVIEEYKVRLLIKLDSVVEFAKYVNKLFLLTGEYEEDESDYVRKIDLLSVECLKEKIISILNYCIM